MPPHCDTLDGPVVTAGRHALDVGDVDLALPFVPADGEDEVRAAFDLARKARDLGPEARTVADLYFFDTLVRVHRRGEGAPHTGLKPAGLDVGPVIPRAEQALADGDPAELAAFLQDAVADQTRHRLEEARRLRAEAAAAGCVPAARAATSAELDFLVWAHRLWQTATGHDHHH